MRRADRAPACSTESGIPDFRSPTGLWAQFDPLEYGSIEAFRRDPRQGLELLRAAVRDAHRGRAERRRTSRSPSSSGSGFVEAVVTQNIDLLHERAGSREVVEVHGSIRTRELPGLRRARTRSSAVLELLADGRTRAALPARAAPILKPDVVFFGELLPAGGDRPRARARARGARLLLVVGSSLEVYPVAGLPERDARAGGQLAIVNRGPDAATTRGRR